MEGPPKVEHIDIADDGTIVATTIREEIYMKHDINSKWSKLPGNLMQISTAGSDRIVGASSNGTIW